MRLKTIDLVDGLLILLMIATLIVGFARCNASAETKTIMVPVAVAAGDTLDSIVIKLADKYGDNRDYRVIRYYAVKDNNLHHCRIYPGDILNISLEVPHEGN